MSVKREDLHKLIECVPEELLPTIRSFLETLVVEEEPTEEEERTIREAIEEYKRGEYFTFEEVFGENPK